jgi:hypothetical protein
LVAALTGLVDAGFDEGRAFSFSLVGFSVLMLSRGRKEGRKALDSLRFRDSSVWRSDMKNTLPERVLAAPY